MGDKHGWNSWNEYQSAHDGYMRYFRSFFVIKDDLITNLVEEAIYIDGRIYCQNGIEIQVHKQLEVKKDNGWVKVRTVEYAYHAVQRITGEVTNLFRYDNIHLHEGHPDRHHRHTHDETGAEVSIDHVGYCGWPTLAEVIEEAYKWNTAKLQQKAV